MITIFADSWHTGDVQNGTPTRNMRIVMLHPKTAEDACVSCCLCGDGGGMFLSTVPPDIAFQRAQCSFFPIHRLISPLAKNKYQGCIPGMLYWLSFEEEQVLDKHKTNYYSQENDRYYINLLENEDGGDDWVSRGGVRAGRRRRRGVGGRATRRRRRRGGVVGTKRLGGGRQGQGTKLARWARQRQEKEERQHDEEEEEHD
ncbi:hypothetical protein Pelo_15969 [Pelomyxa schiedti]|nr:hypothetical protein Pelo_15969 [Pelomyxa schiedti]